MYVLNMSEISIENKIKKKKGNKTRVNKIIINSHAK